MHDLNHYLDMAKAKSGSDYRTAQELGVTRATISGVRQGAGMSDDTALTLADYLGIDPIGPIAAAAAQRSKSPAMKQRWEQLARGAVAMLCLVMAMGYSSEGTAATEATVSAGNENVIGIMRTFEGVFGGASASICDISAGVFFTGRARRCS